MTLEQDQPATVDQLVEEFLDRRQQGETPSIEDYCNQYPHLSDEIRDVFEAVLMVEELKPGSQDDHESIENHAYHAAEHSDTVGDYKIWSVIGRGGMGVVYEAEQQSLGRRVALKVLPRSMAGDSRSLARFQREARAAARMHHTNIVPVFDVGSEGDVVFYAMQLIRGQGLDHVINDLRRFRDEDGSFRRQPRPSSSSLEMDNEARSIAESIVDGRFSRQSASFACDEQSSAGGVEADESGLACDRRGTETVSGQSGSTISTVLTGDSEASSGQTNFYRSVARIGIQAADALAYAHERGIIHRDIKPSNLLLDAAGVLWITDFGLAKTGDSKITETGDVLGTIRYMSPERFRGQCDYRADIYSLGLTLYEMLTLRPAFSDSSRASLIDQICRNDAPAPRSFDSRLPRDLETVVLKAIDKDPKRRYQSAIEFRDDLQRFANDESVHARRISPAERFVRWSRHNKTLSSLAFVVASLLVFIAVSSAMMFQQTRVEKETQAEWIYSSNMREIGRALDAGRPSLTASDRLLDQLPGDGELDRREFAWRYLWGRAHENSTVTQIPGVVSQLAFSDGGILAVVSDEPNDVPVYWKRVRDRFPEVYRWDPVTDDVRVVYSPKKKLFDLALSSRGTHVVFNADMQIGMIDLGTGLEQWIVDTPYGVSNMSFSQDGQWLMTMSADGARVFDAATGRQQVKSHIPIRYGLDRLRYAEVCADGTSVILANYPMNGAATVRDMEKSASTFSPVDRLLQHWSERTTVPCACFSGDGQYAAWTDCTGEVGVWDRRKDDLFVLQDDCRQASCIAISPQGSFVSIGYADGYVSTWNLKTRSRVTSSKVHRSAVTALCFSANEKELTTSDSGGFVSVFSVEPERRPFYRNRYGHGVLSLGFSPDGQKVAISTRRKYEYAPVSVCDLQSREWVPLKSKSDDRKATEVRFSPDGSEVAMGCIRPGQVQLTRLDFAADRTLVVPDDHRPQSWRGSSHRSVVGAMDYSPNGQWIAAGFGLRTAGPGEDYDQVAAIWDVSSGKVEKMLTGFKSDIRGLQFSPDGKTLATASMDGTIRLFETGSWRVKRTLSWTDNARYTALVYSRDGKNLAAGQEDGDIVTWNVGSHDFNRIQAHSRQVSSLAYSKTGRTLASGSWDGTVKIWDTWSNQELMTLREGEGFVYDIEFDPQGDVLAVASHNGTVHLHYAKQLDQIDNERTAEKAPARPVAAQTSEHDSTDPIVSGTSKARRTSLTTKKVTDANKMARQGNEAFQGLTPLYLPGTHPIYAMDGKRVFLIGNGGNWTQESKTVRSWDMNTGEAVDKWVHDLRLRKIAVSSDESLLVAGDWNGGLVAWDCSTGERLWSNPGRGKGHLVERLAISRDVERRSVATLYEDGHLSIVDAANGKLKHSHSFEDCTPQEVNFSVDGHWLLVGSPCVLIDTSNSAVVGRFPMDVRTPIFGPDSRTIATSNPSDEIILWDWDGKKLAKKTSWRVGDEGNVPDVSVLCFNVDGARLVSIQGSKAIVWDVASQSKITEFGGERFSDCAWNPTRSQFAVSSALGVQFFDVGGQFQKIDSSILDDYVGRYQRSMPGPNQYTVVKREGDKLRITPGISKDRLWSPLSESTFGTLDPAVIPDTHTFVRDESGNVSHLVSRYQELGLLITQPRISDTLEESSE